MYSFQYISLLAFGFNEQEKTILQNHLIWLLPAVLFYLPLGAIYSILKSARQFSILIDVNLFEIYQFNFIIFIFNNEKCTLLSYSLVFYYHF